MPGMGGIKCLVELTRIDPDVKVIISSGYAANVKIEDVISRKAVAGFIHKPYRIEELLKSVERVLE